MTLGIDFAADGTNDVGARIEDALKAPVKDQKNALLVADQDTPKKCHVVSPP
ncbi:MAG TPA: hypothetical protein VKU01_24265 [Bryobacteraceae bacterium]|nr:hypothetical protein [Bryobacteraceae bacterium]